MQPYSGFLTMLTFAAMTSSHPCRDPYPGPDIPPHEWTNFHWLVLGVSNQSADEKVEKLIDVLLQGFNCEARLRVTRNRCPHRNLTCSKVKQEILGNKNHSYSEEEVHEIAARAFLFGLDLEHMACWPPKDERPSCRLHLRGRLMDFRLSRRWRPELMRHLVWRDCPESEAFVKRRNCFKLNFILRSSVLPCDFVMKLVSHLIQGNRILTGDNERCDLQYTDEIFREFGNASEHSARLIDRQGLTSILKNLSNPYPPLPTRSRLKWNHHSHFQPHPKLGEHPDPDTDRGNIRPEDTPPPEQGPPATDATILPISPGKHHGDHPPSRPEHGGEGFIQGTEIWTHQRDVSLTETESTKQGEDVEEIKARQRKRSEPDTFLRPYDEPYSHWTPHHSSQKLQPNWIWNSSILLDLYGTEDDKLTMFGFSEMCPVLLNQLLFVYNLPVITAQNSESGRKGTTEEVYGYGSLSVFLISLCSLVGVVFVKCSNERVKNYVMATMLALAVGNLCGDAILHLVPEVIGAKGSDVDGDGHFTNEVMLVGESDINVNSVKMMLMLASIYLFFLLEMVTSICHTHDHDLEVVEIMESQIPKKQALRRVTGSNAYQQDTNARIGENQQPSMEVAIPNPDFNGSPLPSVPEEVEEQEAESRIQVTVKKKDQRNLQAPMTLAWMVVVGDGIHNFADGLEIGATFSSGLASGLSTSLAVICHELPHELGDFAVLISTGMSIKRAMALNFVSALTAFIGLYVGILTGQHDDVRELIFAVGAGMFLYVALGNLVPELMKYFRKYRNWTMFFCQNIGLLVGYVAMVLIAIYEDEIVVH